MGRRRLRSGTPAAGLLAAVVMTLGACGSSASGSGATGGTDPSYATSTTTTMPPPPLVNSWTIASTGTDGATWTSVFATGNLISGAKITTSIWPSLLSACNVNPQTDAVVPFEITTTSTTTGGFAAAGDSRFSLINSTDDQFAPMIANANESIEEVANYSTGEQCQNVGQQTGMAVGPSIGASLNGGTGTQGPTVVIGIFVLSHWASPAIPSGDSSFLPSIFVSVLQTNANQESSSWTTDSVAGPKVVSLGDNALTAGGTGTVWVFPLDGTNSFDCSYLMTPRSGYGPGQDAYPPASTCQPLS